MDSTQKVSTGSCRESWQKTLPGLPRTGRIMQTMAKMDSTSTKPMKALNRPPEGNSGWEGKLQNSTFGPDYNLNSCHACSPTSPFVSQTNRCGEVKIVYSPFLLHLSIQSTSIYRALQQRTLAFMLSFTSERKKKTACLRSSF